MNLKKTTRAQTLILGLGNDLLSDDAVGILIARKLLERLNGCVDVEESSLAGLALFDIFIGYEQVIIVDSIQTNRHPPGTIHELDQTDLDTVVAPSPHYAGIPEMLALAKKLQLDFPQKIKIFAMEVADPFRIGGGLSKPVESAMMGLIQRVLDQVNIWNDCSENTTKF